MQFPTRIGVDRDGYIINQTSEKKISWVYKKLLEEILDILKKCIVKKLHGVYICKSLNEDIIDTLNSYRKSIVEEEFDSNTSISALKRIVRGVYCLVSLKDNSWSINIQDNLDIVQHYFPKEEFFKKAEKALLNKESISHSEVLYYIDYFIIWFKNKTKDNILF